MSREKPVLVAALVIVAFATPAHAQTLFRLPPRSLPAPVRLDSAKHAEAAVCAASDVTQPDADQQWITVRALPPGSKAEVHQLDGAILRGRVTAANPDWLTITVNERDTRIERATIKRVRVPSPGRRLIAGILGVGAGLAAGFLVCPSCANEGAPGIRNTAMTIGGAVGTLGFLIPQYRTVYNEPKR